MEYLVTSEEMRAYDTYTIEQIGIPSTVLMERAALKTTERILKIINEKNNGNTGKCERILCVCGTGNNGGDGICVARLLKEQDIEADVVLLGSREKLTKETAMQLSALEAYGIAAEERIPEKEYDIIVDALFGTGLSRNITGDIQTAIEQVNKKQAYKIAIDIPSGIDADTGKVLGCAVKADETVAIAFKKRGHMLYPGCQYAGKIIVAAIGITQKSFHGRYPEMFTYTEPVTDLLPKRIPSGNKGTFGKILIVAGNEQMAGAALLCGESTYRSGAGMVKLMIPDAIREIVQTRLPEALIQTYASENGITEKEREAFLKAAEWADVTAIGPGLGKSQSAFQLLQMALLIKQPLVIDADGLNILAQDKQNLWTLLKERKETTILTPHMGEMARLLQKSLQEVVADETKASQELAEQSGCIVVGKSARTHVCRKGMPIFLNTSGNHKMATAGSGDVLTGMIAALLAAKAENAAELGVYLHACAGDAAAEKAGQAGITASDIIRGMEFLT